MRILATISYVGTNYGGWQVQPDNKSIEEEVEKVLSKVLNAPTKIYGSGRTDAGVHALRQTFHFDVKHIEDLGKFRYSINSLLPQDMYILSMEEVSEDFHARFNVKSKTYSYYINVGTYDPFSRERVYQYLRPLDLEKMREALSYFEGEHCFKNFTSKLNDEDNYVRTIYKASLQYQFGVIKITFNGNGFMKYMVRMMVGMLIEIGSGRFEPLLIKNLLEQEERKIVSFKAPSMGLYLEEVNY